MTLKTARFLAAIWLLFLSSPAISGDIGDLAVKLSSEIKFQNLGKIAILEFSGIAGSKSQTPGIVQERLTTAMAQDKSLNIIERNLLKRVLDEQRLQISGAINDTDAKAIGKIAGADAVVTGTISDLDNNEIEINARVIHVESGKIVAAGIARIKREWAVSISPSSSTFSLPPELADWLDQEQKPGTSLTAADKAAFEKMMPILNSVEKNWQDSEKMLEGVAAIDKVLETPSMLDGYFRYLRAMFNLQAKKYAEAIKDVNVSIGQLDSKSGLEMLKAESLYSLRAKAAKALGDYKSAAADLKKAISLSPKNPRDVIGNSGLNALESSPGDMWRKSDFDDIIRRNPADYQGYLFRGFYFSAYVLYDQRARELAIADYRKAIQLTPQSAMAHYLLGRNLREAKEAIAEYSKAIQYNAKMAGAYQDRAQAYYDAKRYDLAIKDYTKLLGLDPQNGEAYNDRGLAKSYLEDNYGAIWDLGDAIRLKKQKSAAKSFDDVGETLSLANTYENRARVNIQVKDYRAAIGDLTLAIHCHIKSSMALMTATKFRELYPEFRDFTDDMLAEMLWKKYQPYGPNGKYEDFAKSFGEKQDKYFSSSLSELYVMRADAYLKDNDVRLAIRDYNRAASNKDYAVVVWNDRWKPLDEQSGEQLFLDIKTVDFTRPNTPVFWLKHVGKESDTLVYNYKINCASKQINSLGTIVYDSQGSVKNQTSSEQWGAIVPQSIGEKMYLGMCN